jgi:hypothetical protein
MTTTNAGVQNLQIVQENSCSGPCEDTQNVFFNLCANCWEYRVEDVFTWGAHMQAENSFNVDIEQNYFSGCYNHTSGAFDCEASFLYFTSNSIMQNNIFDRLHASIIMQNGASGNVIFGNYSTGNFDDGGGAGGSPFLAVAFSHHGSTPSFSLWEENVGNQYYPDSVNGATFAETTFRNWIRGTDIACSPTARASQNPSYSVVCTPAGYLSQAGVNGFYEYEAARAYQVGADAAYMNGIGDVVGFTTPAVLFNSTGNPIPVTATLSYSSARTYDAQYGFTFGYSNSSDDGDGACQSPCIDNTVIAATYFGCLQYNNISATTSSCGSVSTLPNSFFYSSKPAWWGSQPWPAIGPDVTGGSGPGNHTNMIPAQNCYINVMGGAEGGTGSPLSFNPGACYSATPPPATSNSTIGTGATISGGAVIQ